MSEVKLLPCPFCGGEHIIESCNEFVPCLKCLGCGSIMTVSMDFKGNYKKELIKKWNTRKPMERILEKLNERIEHHVKLVNYEMNMGTIVDVERHEEAIKATDKAIEIVKEKGGIE